MAFKPSAGEVFLNKYEIVSLVGEGAFGSVYRARDIKLDRIVAIKFINIVNDVLERFNDELEAIKGLDHPNIVRLYDFDILKNGMPCMVMEYINGREVGDVLCSDGPFDLQRICDIALQVLDALVETHKNGIVHCDLKPENVLVTTADGRVKIIDIGLPETDYKTDHELLIKENEFIAPELFKGEEADQRSDVYSLGKIIEFIIERNMLSQYSGVATHCTQFSREQRFDSIMEVRSFLTKRTSTVKIILLLLALILIGVAAFIYVPKIIEKSRIEKEERLAVEFGHEMEKINAEMPALCEKYKLTSIEEPVDLPAAWKEDSVRFSQQLARFMGVDSLRRVAEQALENQRQTLLLSRQRDYDTLWNELRQAADSIAPVSPTL